MCEGLDAVYKRNIKRCKKLLKLAKELKPRGKADQWDKSRTCNRVVLQILCRNQAIRTQTVAPLYETEDDLSQNHQTISKVRK